MSVEIKGEEVIVKLPDGSSFEVPDTWLKALKLKCGDKWLEELRKLPGIVEEFWCRKLTMWKGLIEPWPEREPEEFGFFGPRRPRNMAELAEDILYSYLRPALFAIAGVRVIALRDDGSVAVYTSKHKEEYEDIEEFLKKVGRSARAND